MTGSTLDATRAELALLVLYLNKAEARDKICRAIQYGSKFLSGGKPGTAQNVDKTTSSARKVFRLLKFVNGLNALIRPPSSGSPLPFILLGKLGELRSTSAALKKLEKELKQDDKYKDECYRTKLKQSNQRLLSLIKASMDIVVAVGLLQLAPKKITPRVTGGFGFITSLISCYQVASTITQQHYKIISPGNSDSTPSSITVASCPSKGVESMNLAVVGSQMSLSTKNIILDCC
ncbi:hypothetical protein B296_00038157 [Ensete ventricosum]|uniref:Peroxisomal membrane protein 11D n=1 Tax=Ensete ventricosum TaxID=4639 RepID=A0A426Y6N8_ENSVE|nr:hypothetical protein B296_00038157 [Ensete ventricosum]